MVIDVTVRDNNNWRVAKKAAANLPQTAQSALFNVNTGAVEVKIVGVVSSNIQNQANNTKIVANPTGGTDTDMCTVLDIDNDQGGEMYVLNGTSNALGNETTAGAIDVPATSYFVQAGTIDLNCAASNTGTVLWYCFWRPIDVGATVTSA
jgi:hypothetical protein